MRLSLAAARYAKRTFGPQPPEPAPGTMRGLGRTRPFMNQEARKIVSGLGWVSAASYANRALGFITTLILARLLAPDQFGAVAVGAMMVDVLKIFRDMGLGQALIYRKSEEAVANDTAMAMIVGLNLGLFVLAAVAAPWVARFFADPSLTPVLIVMSANLLPLGLRAVPDALIRKRGQFDRLAIPDVVPVFISSIAGVVLAAAGYGVWSLVARTLIASVLAATMIWWFTDYRPRMRFDRAVAAELFLYGKFVVGATLLSVALLNIDKLYLGRLGGVDALGLYTMAWIISSIPVTEFGHLLCRVAFPVFCQVNAQPAKLRDIFLGSHTYNAMIVAPIGAAIVLFGPDLTVLLLGEKWTGATRALQILAVASFARAISALIHELLRSVGQVRTVQTFTFARLVLLATLGVPALKLGGMESLCWLIFGSNIFVLSAELHSAARAVGVSTWRTVQPLARPVGIAILAVGLVWTGYVRLGVHDSLLAAILAAALAVAAYLGAVVATHRTLLNDARRLFAHREQ